MDKLGPEASEEDNLNAGGILQDALETKEFYTVVSRRNNVLKMLDFASGTNPDSQSAALGVLTQLVALHADRKKERARKEEDEEEVQHQSEEEDEDFLEVIASSVGRLVAGLAPSNEAATL